MSLWKAKKHINFVSTELLKINNHLVLFTETRCIDYLWLWNLTKMDVDCKVKKIGVSFSSYHVYWNTNLVCSSFEKSVGIFLLVP